MVFKFLVIDDHALVRTGLVLTLHSLDPEAVIYEASDVNEAMLVVRDKPDLDLVIIDLRLPVIDGLAGLGLIRQRHPGLRVAVITAQYTPGEVQQAMERGAVAFIPKTFSTPQTLEILRGVLAGGSYTPGDPAWEGALAPAPALGSGPDGPSVLTDRQMQVLALLVQGKPNKIIGDELKLAPGTVKIHISSVLRALHVTNRTQAVLAAARLGLKL